MALSSTQSYTRAIAARLKQFGQMVTVDRPGSTSPLTQSLQCIPMPDRVAEAQLMAEGGVNALNAQPHIFVFAGSVDVRANDRISYNGGKYRVSRAVPMQILGTPLSLHCYGLREN